MREVVRVYIGRKNPTPSSISNTELIDGVVPLNANGPLRFGPSLNLDHSSTEVTNVRDLPLFLSQDDGLHEVYIDGKP